MGSIDMPDGSVPIGILMSPDGHHSFVANTEANVVTVIDVVDLKIEYTLDAGNTPDGMELATAF